MLTYYIDLCLCAAAVVIASVKTGLSWNLVWVIPVSFIVSFAVLFIAYVAVVGLISLTVSMKKKYEKPSRFYTRVLNNAYGYLSAIGGVRLCTEGFEKLPEGCFMFVSNHCSNYDNMLESVALADRDLAFISKPENFKIPIARRLIRRCCYLAIDREDARKALGTINEAIELVASGTASVGVFPEGTRSKTGRLGEFKNGCFRIAQKARCPIVVAALQGTENIRRNFFRRRTDVRLSILAVIPPEELYGKRTGEISSCVRTMIAEKLGERKNDVCVLQSAG